MIKIIIYVKFIIESRLDIKIYLINVQIIRKVKIN